MMLSLLPLSRFLLAQRRLEEARAAVKDAQRVRDEAFFVARKQVTIAELGRLAGMKPTHITRLQASAQTRLGLEGPGSGSASGPRRVSRHTVAAGMGRS